MQNNQARYLATAAVFLALAAPASVTRAQGPVVRIDFRAVGEDGRPVMDLKPSEVTLRIGGKARTITSLDLVETSATPTAAARKGPAKPAFASNAAQGAAGRTVLLVVDDESVEVGREQGLKAALGTIVEGLGAGDRVGLLSLRRSGGVNIAPTAGHAQITEAIASLKGQAGTENAQDLRCRTTVVLQQLETLAANASAAGPTSVVLFSAALMAPGETIESIGRDRTNTDLCRLTAQNFEQLGTALAGSRAQLYVVHVAEGTSRRASDVAGGVEGIAGIAGVDTLRLSGNGDAVAQRILAETGAYYVATVAADGSDKGTAPQRMELRVARDGVKVRARGHVVPARLAGGSAAARGAKASPRDMIRTAAEFRDLPLRASGYVSRNPGDERVRVIVLFEPDGDQATITSAMIGLYTGEGKLVAQWTSQESDLARSPAMAALVAPPGEYRMRVAAVDNAGRSGAVDQPFGAHLERAGPIGMSTPLLGPAPGPSGFTPKLLFGAQDGAVVSYVELYAVPAGADVKAMLEIAPSEDAPAIGTTDAQVSPLGDDGARVVGGFSIDTLDPGEYTVRTLITVDGKLAGRAITTMRKAGA